MADEIQTVASTGVTTLLPATVDALANAKHSKWHIWRKDGKALIAYLLDSEVHTYAFSVAANAILSFIPFVVLLYTLALKVFHSNGMVDVVNKMVNYFLPTMTGDQQWVTRNILVMTVNSQHGVQAFSLLMILVACTGIFLPLEVALNQAWGVTKSRNYIMNQIVAVGLSLIMALLAVVSIFLNVAVQWLLNLISFGHSDNWFIHSINYIWLALSTGVASILFFFCVYWVLPNRKVPWLPVLRTSIWTGIVWLVAKLIFVAVLPHMHLGDLYGPFYISVGLLFWSYVSGLILFAGAQFSVSRWGDRKE
jgi:YihY family inner membrane protein